MPDYMGFNSALTQNSGVNLSKLLNFYVPQFYHLKDGVTVLLTHRYCYVNEIYNIINTCYMLRILSYI